MTFLRISNVFYCNEYTFSYYSPRIKYICSAIQFVTWFSLRKKSIITKEYLLIKTEKQKQNKKPIKYFPIEKNFCFFLLLVYFIKGKKWKKIL